MKKILFALAIMPLLIVACSSDDDDKTPAIDFDHNIEMLYGEWRATSIEGVFEEAIDITSPEMEAVVTPTYVTFSKDGSFSSKGVLGEGSGKFTTKDKTIAASIGDDKLSFKMTSLEAKTAKIELNPQDLDLGMPLPEELEKVTVVLTKQDKE